MKMRYVLIVVVLAFSVTPSIACASSPEITVSEIGSINEGIVSNINTSGTDTLQTTRISGETRYATSANAALNGWGSSYFAIVVSGYSENWPDAISASGLAGILNCPILLTDPYELSSPVQSVLVTLGVQEIYVIGGCVNSSARTQLANIIGSTSRVHVIAGESRYATAEAVYSAVSSSAWLNPNVTPQQTSPAAAIGMSWKNSTGKKVVVLATGANWPDGVSAANFATLCHYPILLVPEDGILTSGTQSILSNGSFDEVIIMGGTSAISDATATSAAVCVDPYQKSTGETVWFERINGETRYETSGMAAWLAMYQENGSFDGTISFTTGEACADAITGAGLGHPVVFIGDSAGVNSVMLTFVYDTAARVNKMIFLGGTAAIPDSVISSCTEAWFNARSEDS